MFETPNSNDRRKQLQFINAVIHSHDFICECQDSAFHSTKLLLQQIAPELTKQQKIEIQQCLGDTTEETAGDDVDIGIGDLEKLFGDEEEDTTTG